MEMTMTFPMDPMPADFSNQATEPGRFPTIPTVGWMLVSVLAGPSAAQAFQQQQPADPTLAFAADSVGDAVGPHPDAVAEQIAAIKDGWRLNMTELAEIMDVQRPTLYNWLNGKTSPNAEARQKLDLLVAAAPVWNRLTAKSSDAFLLDYPGPEESGPSIRQRLKSRDCTLAEMAALIPTRIKQYLEARSRSLALLGERPPPPKSAPPESARRMNALWAENAKKLHRFRNRAD